MMLLTPGLNSARRGGPPMHLPKLLAWYDSVFSKPEVLPDGRIERVHDISGNGHHLRVRTEANRVHPTCDAGVFGNLPGIGNSLQDSLVELRGDNDLTPFMSPRQTWFVVYKSYRPTSHRMLGYYSNYHTPLDHPMGMSWGRDQSNGFPQTYIPLLPGAVLTFLFNNPDELIVRGNGRQAEHDGVPIVIAPNESYYKTNYAKYLTLFTGYNIYAVEGAFGAAIYCMEALSLQTIVKVEKYLSRRFGLPLSA